MRDGRWGKIIKRKNLPYSRMIKRTTLTSGKIGTSLTKPLPSLTEKKDNIFLVGGGGD